MRRRAGMFAIGCLATIGVSGALRPSRRAAETYQAVNLESQVPSQFADWRIDLSIVPVLPDPATQAKIDQIYTQTLARTYVNQRGQRVMLSVVYGADQGSDATQAHRPEVCYTAQGFNISRIEQVPLAFGRHEVWVARLVGKLGNRIEFITYWLTLNDKTVLPGIRRKLTRIRIGLAGLIPDGMLIRASTVGLEQTESFEVQHLFMSQLYASMEESARVRYFGS